MNQSAVQSIILGNIEALNQGIKLLSSLNDEQYQHIATPFVKSSIGEHFRHVVDMFVAVYRAQEEGYIDYDSRRRGSLTETQRQVAVAELEEIKAWMETLLQEQSEADKAVEIKTEVTLEETKSVHLRSNLLRELIFTCSHAVHHFALIGVIAKLQGIKPDERFGVAPATATYLRACTEVVEDA